MVQPSEPIVRRKLSDEVYERLKSMITTASEDRRPDAVGRRTDGAFRRRPAGDREAMQALNGSGSSRSRTANGPRSSPHAPLPVRTGRPRPRAEIMLTTSPGALDHLKEARIFFERGIVRQAAERAGEADIEAAGRASRRARGALGDPERFIRTDMRFHARIAAIPGNPIFEAVAESMLGLAAAVPHRTPDLERQGERHPSRARGDRRGHRRAATPRPRKAPWCATSSARAISTAIRAPEARRGARPRKVQAKACPDGLEGRHLASARRLEGRFVQHRRRPPARTRPARRPRLGARLVSQISRLPSARSAAKPSTLLRPMDTRSSRAAPLRAASPFGDLEGWRARHRPLEAARAGRPRLVPVQASTPAPARRAA